VPARDNKNRSLGFPGRTSENATESGFSFVMPHRLHAVNSCATVVSVCLSACLSVCWADGWALGAKSGELVWAHGNMYYMGSRSPMERGGFEEMTLGFSKQPADMRWRCCLLSN